MPWPREYRSENQLAKSTAHPTQADRRAQAKNVTANTSDGAPVYRSRIQLPSGPRNTAAVLRPRPGPLVRCRGGRIGGFAIDLRVYRECSDLARTHSAGVGKCEGIIPTNLKQCLRGFAHRVQSDDQFSTNMRSRQAASFATLPGRLPDHPVQRSRQHHVQGSDKHQLQMVANHRSTSHVRDQRAVAPTPSNATLYLVTAA